MWSTEWDDLWHCYLEIYGHRLPLTFGPELWSVVLVRVNRGMLSWGRPNGQCVVRNGRICPQQQFPLPPTNSPVSTLAFFCSLCNTLASGLTRYKNNRRLSERITPSKSSVPQVFLVYFHRSMFVFHLAGYLSWDLSHLTEPDLLRVEQRTLVNIHLLFSHWATVLDVYCVW